MSTDQNEMRFLFLIEQEFPEMLLHVSHTFMCPLESLYQTQWAPSTPCDKL